MQVDIPQHDEPGYGQYTSVNDLPMFADVVAANGGPFDPEHLVVVRRSEHNHFTIDGVPTRRVDEDGKVTMLNWCDPLKVAGDGNGVHGFYATPGYGFVFVDLSGSRYTFARDVNVVDDVIYDVYFTLRYVAPGNNALGYMDEIYIPSDHPFLQSFVKAE